MSGYDKYGVCPCGFYKRAPFGSLVHIHLEVCPRCGESKWGFKVVVGRVVWKGGCFRGHEVFEALVAAPAPEGEAA